MLNLKTQFLPSTVIQMGIGFSCADILLSLFSSVLFFIRVITIKAWATSTALLINMFACVFNDALHDFRLVDFAMDHFFSLFEFSKFEKNHSFDLIVSFSLDPPYLVALIVELFDEFQSNFAYCSFLISSVPNKQPPFIVSKQMRTQLFAPKKVTISVRL